MKLNIKFYDTVVGDMNEAVLSYDEDGVTVDCDGKTIKLIFEEDYGEFCYRIRKRSKMVLVHSKENFKWTKTNTKTRARTSWRRTSR